MSYDPTILPPNLPVPEDDGAADHLRGAHMPPIALPSTDGGSMRVDVVPDGAERLVVYAFPRTGRPDERPLVPDWDEIPGARGCTPETCGFRDHAADLRAVGAAVAGLSTQDTEYQRELVERLRLPFPLLTDTDLALTRALDLPTFEAAGHTLLKRLTLVVRDGAVEQVFYPVFPPDTHAAAVLEWCRSQT
ncbi:MAG: peroxiredoxin [Actinobacteria bacterium]|nr:MAG: peroxiredoxin [Actinomycetota bacterium]